MGILALVLSAGLAALPHGSGSLVASSHPVALATIHMITPTTGWADNTRAVLRTTDGGSHWRNVTPPGRFSAPVADQFLGANTAWVVENHTDGTVTLVHTNTAGRTWQPAGFWPQYASLPKQLDFVTSQQGWLLIGGGSMHANALALFQTRDAGHHWSTVAWSSSAVLADFIGMQYGWAIISDSVAGRLYATSDGGRHWHHVPSTVSLTDVEALDFVTSRIGFALVGRPTAQGRFTLLKTRDGGQTWITLHPRE